MILLKYIFIHLTGIILPKRLNQSRLDGLTSVQMDALKDFELIIYFSATSCVVVTTLIRPSEGRPL